MPRAPFLCYNLPKGVSIMDNKDEKTADGQRKKDPLWYDGEGDLLDTAKGRADFCRLNETSLFRKKDPNTFNDYIFVYNVQGEGLVIKRRSTVDPDLFQCIEYDADGNETNRFFDPA